MRPLPRINCKGCGINFKPRRSIQEFCSSSCAGRITLKTNRRRLPRVTMVELSCEHCGKEIHRWKCNIVDSGHVYCSRDCAVVGGRAVRAAVTRRKNGAYMAERMYSHAKRGWREIGGRKCFFRSRMEANYARYLAFLGIGWDYEPKTFWFDGVKRGVVSYTPDFWLPGRRVFIECKGWMDPKSKTKLKRMRIYHPGVVVEVFDWKRYKAVERQLSRVIPGWENYQRPERTEIDITPL